jgi:hypothetical protein
MKLPHFSVRWVPGFGDTRYGVHFKDTNEFGLYTIFFYHDDREPDKEPSEDFYRSNANFDEEIYLDDIRIDDIRINEDK